MDCSCRPGYFLCPVAVRLWQLENEAYTSKDNTLYKKAQLEYNNHFL